MRCVCCDHRLAFLPDLGIVGSLSDPADDIYRSPLPQAADRSYRLCRNYTEQDACNWAVPSDEPGPLCRSCCLTQVIPDLSVPDNKKAWVKIETAKRRLIYTLLGLKLPLPDRTSDPKGGLAVKFLADPADPKAPRVLTGHNEGVIVLNIAEADDAERERRRHQMGEPYRTLLGHFRHEIGHFYWDQLIRESEWLEQYRALFGDERTDYTAALKRHYKDGPPKDWEERFISTYATSHPWEDWAETWAHYLHMIDTLETAADCGLSLRPAHGEEPKFRPVPTPQSGERAAFDRLIDGWFPLTYLMNNLNRGMGLVDAYPFVLAPPVIEKLRFVHECISNAKVDNINKVPKDTLALTT
jgi:hypothetical protein